MYDPLSQPGIVLAYLAALLAIGIGATLWSRISWRRELAHIRSGLLKGLGFPGDVAEEGAAAWARGRIEALALCRERPGPRGATEAGRGGKCWLCVTADRILLVRGCAARAIPLDQVRRIALSDAPSGKSCRLVIESAPGPIPLDLPRVEDMVRVLNLAVKHHVAVGYLRT
jgi:hypothetical protein